MPHSHTNSVPVIVTTDLSTNNDAQGDNTNSATAGASLSPAPSNPTSGHARRPSDPNYLHPILRIPSADPSAGTAPSSPEGSINVPPSPTLSASSVHFQTSVALRSNDPESKSAGIGSLAVLGETQGHSRKGSVNSVGESTEGTEPDPHSGTRSDTTSVTANGSSRLGKTHSPKSSQDKSSERKGTSDSDATKNQGSTVAGGPEGEDAEAEARPARPDASQDTTDPTPYAYKPLQLASLVDPKNIELLRELGGADGLIAGLGTHRTRGLAAPALVGVVASSVGDATTPAPNDVEAGPTSHDKGGGGGGGDAGGPAYGAAMDVRKRVYGENILPTRPSKSLLLLMWLALKDKILVLLCVAAVVSLALGLYQDFGVDHPVVPCPDDPLANCAPPPLDFVEGVAIVVAIAIVVLVGSVNDWQKERQFRALNEKKEDRGVKVIRCGKEQIINVKDVVVGDIALLEPGEIIPCDGVFLRGHNVRCDESGATGESDAIKKAPYEEIIAEFEAGKLGDHKDCFLLSGAKVIEGVGEYVVIAVGQKSFNGRIMMALRGDTENTPLQLKLNALAELIAKIGGLAGLILFTALMIKFFVQLVTKPDRLPAVKANNFIQILVISVTLIVVAVPEGLPLAVTLALAFATKRMTKENLLVRVLGSCETMANATVICTDKTGTLTSNVMTVVAGSVGVHGKFVSRLEENQARSNALEKEDSGSSNRKFAEDFSIDQSDLNSILTPAARDLFNQAIAVNSTAFEDKDPETGLLEFVGSKTETALLRFAKELGWDDYKKTREAAQVMQMIPFSSERKAMGVVVKLPNSNKYRVYLKGASEILTKLCTHHIVVRNAGDAGSSSQDDQINTKRIDERAMDNISRTIIFYANQTLRTIAICYRDLDSWPPRGTALKQDEVPYEAIAKEMTLIGITGIEDPLRPSVRDAVAQCHKAGVTVKMCTGDNVLTARSIATQCGIYTAGGIIMEGPVFRTLSDSEMLEVVPRLQVLARSSPEDKKILVERLKSLGETVGVTGDGTNDGPALKTANVGFSMGIAGTEVAKEASDIVLMDDNFASIVSAIMWGRCVNDAVRKFLQFQISVNITAVIITFVSAVASDEQKSVLTAVQLLWINIIMDTFAALALATDPAHVSLLARKPDPKTAPLFSVDMTKQILGQSLFQTAAVLILNYAGPYIFGLRSDGSGTAIRQANELRTTVFNTFVFCQIFNSINSRRIDNHLNVFAGLFRNYYFIGITLLEVAIQVLIVFVGSYAFSVAPIGGRDWAVSVVVGFLALPLGALIRLIPNGPIERFAIKVHLMRDPNALPTTAPETEKEGWNSTVNLVKDNLNTFARVRGGRMRSSSFVIKSRSARLHEAGVQLPSLLAVVPALIATSVGAAWTPQPGLHDPAHSDPSRSSAALWEGKLQLHPETKQDDPAFKKWGAQMPPKENV